MFQKDKDFRKISNRESTITLGRLYVCISSYANLLQISWEKGSVSYARVPVVFYFCATSDRKDEH